jgi:DNA helicase-2/ATP-dependent DNA helicase PcrA
MELEGLNKAQQQAVLHKDGPALVVAGAGTGKTRVITQRIAHLISSGAAEPGQILALTFTEKAAREMAERLYDLIGWHSYQVAVLTFNAFGAELLGRYASHIGRSIGGGLLNDTQKALLLQEHIDRADLSYYGPHINIFEFLEGVVQYIGRLQNANISADIYNKYTKGLKPGEGLHPQDIAEQQDLSSLYSLYEAIKAETGTFDYNDQLQIPLQILQQKPNLAARLQRQYRYVLVDEYQDTNSLQDDLLRAFIPPTGNLFAVGDDDQAIYGFRGAQIGNILAFTDHYKVKQPLALIENYRSGQEILDASYRLITHNNPDRLEARLGLNKRLKAQHAGSTVEFVPYRSQADELTAVQDAIEKRLKAGADPASVAVLAATHAPLSQMAKGLRIRNLPFALSTRVDIFEQPELNQLWYLMEWIGLRADEESLAHVMLSPFIGWTAEQYRQLVRQSQEELSGIEDSLRASDTEPAKEAVAKLDLWREWAKAAPVSLLAYRLVFETGVSDWLRNQAGDHPRIRRVFEDLGQLLAQMQDYETVGRDRTLAGYLKAFPKPPGIEVTEPIGEREGVQLLTVHAAKGLEFDVVYLIGCTQRSWSGGRSQGWEVPPELIQTPDLPPEHEQRRLMYVAATRARQELVLSAATQTSGGAKQTVSPFVAELLGKSPLTDVLPDKTGSDIDKSLHKLQRFYPLRQPQDTRLPFETTDGWLELGVSGLGSYDFCPYDFFLEQVLGISQPFGPQLAFGTALHGAIQAYYQAKLRSEDIAVAELDARLDELWSDRGYATRRQAEQAKSAAHEALHNFLTRERDTKRTITASELPIKLEIPEAKLRLKGRIDALFDTPGGVELRDFKTGRKTNAEALARTAKSSFQLRTYALAYEEMTGQAPAAVTLDYVVTGIEGSAELSGRILTNHRAKLVELAAAIRAGDFAPKPSNVHQCAAIRYYGTGEEDEQVLEGVSV